MNLSKNVVGLALITLLVTGCGSDDKEKESTDPAPQSPSPSASVTQEAEPTTEPTPESNGLREAVQAYSDAFLTGDATGSYDLLSARCQERHSLSYWTGIITAAKEQFGDALPIATFEEKVDGDKARVTYTYSVASINQTDEPWVNESGWKNDDC